ncbi:Uu.00g022280.m01.CDS01 [Anthostomella pinea]|uniref:Uu.00g022280.m01.CDS01 n=1 Tax=Anthostomella pinea TaxID=933095 RepID=A0AAI8VZS9_9PEZI|nr:Uu.00g022280.m01.CDS01 [Anthostomella pinea]
MVFFTNAITGALIGGAGLVNAYSGDMTFFTPGLGACGQTNGAGDFIVALSQAQYNGNCGRSIKVTYQGKTAVAKVVDLCPGCGSGSIDASPAVFNSLAYPDLGRVHVDWVFV